MKMHPLFDSAIIGILRADPSAVILLLRNNRQLAWHRRLRNRLLAALQQSNERHLIDRVVFVNQRPHAEYMLLLCALDVSLDPFPFGGGVTLCDCLEDLVQTLEVRAESPSSLLASFRVSIGLGLA